MKIRGLVIGRWVVDVFCSMGESMMVLIVRFVRHMLVDSRLDQIDSICSTELGQAFRRKPTEGSFRAVKSGLSGLYVQDSRRSVILRKTLRVTGIFQTRTLTDECIG